MALIGCDWRPYKKGKLTRCLCRHTVRRWRPSWRCLQQPRKAGVCWKPRGAEGEARPDAPPASGEARCARTRVWDLQPPGLGSNECGLKHPVCGLRQPKPTNTGCLLVARLDAFSSKNTFFQIITSLPKLRGQSHHPTASGLGRAGGHVGAAGTRGRGRGRRVLWFIRREPWPPALSCCCCSSSWPP